MAGKNGIVLATVIGLPLVYLATRPKTEPPPDGGGGGETPVFTITDIQPGNTPYDIPVPYVGTLHFLAPKVSATIRNDGTIAASHVVTLYAEVTYDFYGGDPQNPPPPSTIAVASEQITLQPGQAVTFLYDAYAPVLENPNNIPSQLIADNHDGVHDDQHWMIWFQDELGNATAQFRIG